MPSLNPFKSKSGSSSKSKSGSSSSKSKSSSSKSKSSSSKSKSKSSAPPAGTAPVASTKELKTVARKLTKVKTKEGGDGPASAEIKAYAKVYDECKGDLKKVSKKLGGVKFKKDAKFKDGKAFAKSFLAGLCLDE